MADSEKGGGGGMPYEKFIGILIFAFLVFLASERILTDSKYLGPIFGTDETETEILTEDGPTTVGLDPLSSLNLSLGDSIRNREEIVVRQSPGGAPIGKQPKREKGLVVEGPVERFDVRWWRIDYPEAPDGWVASVQVTNKVALFIIWNIIPITLGFLKPLAIIISVILLIALTFIILKKKELKRFNQKKKEVAKEQKIIKEGHHPLAHHYVVTEDDAADKDADENDLPIPNLPVAVQNEKPKTTDVSNKRWANIQHLIRSYNSNDWKQAIMEADIILEEMLDKMGYKGQSIGDQLKQIEESDFVTLNQAWEAHKFRNKIAHGHNYVLSKDEAERIIDLYKQVFSEFFFI